MSYDVVSCMFLALTSRLASGLGGGSGGGGGGVGSGQNLDSILAESCSSTPEPDASLHRNMDWHKYGPADISRHVNYRMMNPPFVGS